MQRSCQNRLKRFKVLECTCTFRCSKARTMLSIAPTTRTICRRLQKVSWLDYSITQQKSLQSPTRPSTRTSDLFLALKHQFTFHGRAITAVDSFVFQFQNAEAILQRALNIVRQTQRATHTLRFRSSWLRVCAVSNRDTNFLPKQTQTCLKWTMPHSRRWVSNNYRSRFLKRCA